MTTGVAQDDPRSRTTLVVGIVGAIFMLAVVVLTEVLFYDAQRREDEQKIYAPRPRELAELQVRQLSQISESRVVDPNEHIVAFPIDRAMEVWIGKMKSAPPAATMPVPGSGAGVSEYPESTP